MAGGWTSKGRVFISHSSLDKEFVRRLNSGLEEAGFKTWLDEKRLRVGDQIAKEIGTAIAEAGALIVVVSRNSAKSDWLIYEINLATERAIRGELRILPVLVDTDALPPELKGRLYADFRTSFDKGLESVIASLKGDRRVARKRRPPQKASSRWRSATSEIEAVLDQIFDSRGWSSGGGDFKSIDYDLVIIETADRGRLEIAVDTVLDYGSEQPLTDASYQEYVDAIQEYAVEAALLITQRPISFSLKGFSVFAARRVVAHGAYQEKGWIVDGRALDDIRIVVVDISDAPDTAVLRERLLIARTIYEDSLKLE